MKRKTPKKRTKNQTVKGAPPVAGDDYYNLADARLESVEDARRLMGRVTLGFLKKRLDSVEAKTVAYLLSVYCQISKDSDFEKRLSDIEEQLRGT
ncbi:MAG: hypothetical protein GF418_14595 [Chitinivibrionales bacterium]|nr:hypothetical protein [Chitinivibrionales bacterium]MBD3396849.1 hypothetical protein [Chitinivibrionales bacterium]